MSDERSEAALGDPREEATKIFLLFVGEFFRMGDSIAAHAELPLEAQGRVRERTGVLVRAAGL
jgi:hypothetical protein